MLKRKSKYAFGGLASLAKTVAGKGDLISKISSSAGGLESMLGGFNKPTSNIDQEVEKATVTSNAIGSGLKTGATMAADAVVPGLGTALNATSSLGQSIAKTGKVGNVIGKAIDPLATIGALGNAFTGDFQGALDNTVVGAGLNAVGLKNIFGESTAEKARKEALKKQDLMNNQNYLKNNTFYKAKNGLKFQEGGKLNSFDTNSNIILKGVLHKEKNEIGDKGIPVIDCNTGTCEKVAEIEKEELVFTKDVTKQLDSYVMKYNRSKDKETKKQIALQLGTFVKQQLDKNTIDNTKI